MTSRFESILAAIVAVAILALATWWHLGQVKKAERAVHAHYAVVLADIRDKTAVAATEFRARETLWQTSIEKETKDGQDRIDGAHSDGNGGHAAANSLRTASNRYSTATRAATHSSSSAPGQGDSGPDPLDLLTGMLARHSDELVEVGRYADELHARGLTCERGWDALTTP